MFQFITNPNVEYTIPEQVQMAVESGCKWIQLKLATKDKETVELASEICREAGVILTIENDYELAREVGIHGVHMNNNSIAPAALREMLGAEAIIGYSVETPEAAFLFKGLDIDYISLPQNFTNEQATSFINAVRDCQIDIPIVLNSDFNANNCIRMKEVNASGISGCDSILASDNPVSALKDLLATLIK